MAKIKRLVLGMIPNQKCNLKCEYCYISQVEAWDEPEEFFYSPEYITKCLSKERLGGISLINLTGNGETMLQPDIVDLVRGLLEEGHFVELVTNGTIKKSINEILNFPEEYLSRLMFKVSFHYKELKRLNMINDFFENVKNIKDSRASYTLELMAYDEIEEEIDQIIEVCKANTGAICHATIGRDDASKNKPLLSRHTKTEYYDIWKKLDSEMLKYKLDVLGSKRKEFCYAGAWSIFVDMYTGEAQACYWQPYNQNIFKNPSKKIKFVPVGHMCTQPYCINAHAHLCWGLIPELNAPDYNSMRNRVCGNGEEWLSEECSGFFSSKLYETNEKFSRGMQLVHRIIHPFRLVKWSLRNPKNNIRRIKNYLARKK